MELNCLFLLVITDNVLEIHITSNKDESFYKCYPRPSIT